MPELGKEIENGKAEAAIAAEMMKLTQEQMAQDDKGKFLRGQHAKVTGCAKAEFAVRPGLPKELCWGIFKHTDKPFAALVRFSNAPGKEEHDGKGTGRGVAIKLTEVDGVRAIEGDKDRSQDFLMVDHPVFPFATPEEYIATIARRGTPLVGDFASLIQLALENREALRVIKKIRAQKIASPLETTYWSGSPYWLGSEDRRTGQAVKYSLVPRTTGTSIPDKPKRESDDYLRRAFVKHLEQREAIFDFKVQIQTDSEKMPIEDTRTLWDERASVPVTVAVLTIPRQDEAAIDVCDGHSFNPWHALAEHRPLGGINRLRRHVYEASVDKRRKAGGPGVP